jgi:L-threonylcarbamoyladenylate synthase
MQTELLSVSLDGPQEQLARQLEPAVYILKLGGCVAMPTETVYGLAANATNAKACEGIFAAKGRPSDNPLIVHVSSRMMLEKIVSAIPAGASSLMNAFWPGPLTLLFPKLPSAIPACVTGGHALATVAVRMPSHPVALALIEACGFPLAAPSANRSGRPSPTRPEHVYNDLSGRIPLIIVPTSDNHENLHSQSSAAAVGNTTNYGLSGTIYCDKGIESTVVQIEGNMARILRPGPISPKSIQNVLGTDFIVSLYIPDRIPAIPPESVFCNRWQQQIVTNSQDSCVLSPGMKYVHYAPTCPFILLEASECHPSFSDLLAALVSQTEAHNITPPAFLAYSSLHLNCWSHKYILLGDAAYSKPKIENSNHMASYPSIARDLFDGLRSLDSLSPSFIFMASLPDLHDEALSIMNRVSKAASISLPVQPLSQDWDRLIHFIRKNKHAN